MHLFWFRRDLRLNDNHALFKAIESGNEKVLPIFIFDTHILNKLSNTADARVSFIHEQLQYLHKALNGCLKVFYGKPIEVYAQILQDYPITKVFTNKDYEPYALERDQQIKQLLHIKNIEFLQFKDQVIFEPGEILKDDGKPYTVYTPYKNKCLRFFQANQLPYYPSEKITENLINEQFDLPNLNSIQFTKSAIQVPKYSIESQLIDNYANTRNFPAQNGGTYLGTHLRFGTVSIRMLAKKISPLSDTLLAELFWREFFMQILFYFPHVTERSFKKQYDIIEWENNEKYFEAWKNGKTGYPMVDAGMRELNTTGFMHNRVRMVTASFLVKHLLIDWKWGEAYFAEKLLDFELAANNGNWQWAAGCGCDAAPYFRVFNPYEQHKKFDTQSQYIQKWVPEWQELSYTKEIVVHKIAREKAISHYKKYLSR